MEPPRDHIEEHGEPEGRYANYCRVGHSALEFLFDFGQVHAEQPQATLHTRVVSHPRFAKELLATLRDSVHQYEIDFGVIDPR